MKKPLPDDKAVMKLYGDLLADIKTRIRQAQNRAVMSANAEMLHMYWDIGHMITLKQDAEGWGPPSSLAWLLTCVTICRRSGDFRKETSAE